MVVYGKEVTYWKHWHWEQNASLLEDRLYGVWLTRWVRRFESVSRNHRITEWLEWPVPLGPSDPIPTPTGTPRAGCPRPHPGGFGSSPRRRAHSLWAALASAPSTRLPPQEANVKLLCSCNFHIAPGQRPAHLSPASICKTRSRFHTNISPQAACGATFHESLSCSPPRRSSLSVTRRRCARLRQKVGRGSF